LFAQVAGLGICFLLDVALYLQDTVFQASVLRLGSECELKEAALFKIHTTQNISRVFLLLR
jgi:hypothetical protein